MGANLDSLGPLPYLEASKLRHGGNEEVAQNRSVAQGSSKNKDQLCSPPGQYSLQRSLSNGLVKI